MSRLTPDELDVFEAAHLSTAVFAKAFQPGRFSRPFDPCHKGIFRKIDKKPGDPGYKPQKAVAGFRGSGKSSIIGYATPAKRILYQETHYIMYIGASQENAIEKTEALRDWLAEDPVVKYYFGKVKASSWGKEEFEVKIGSHAVRIKPKGADQKIRGALYRDWRPDLILIDDVEDPNDMDSAEVRAKKKRRFNADIKNLIDRGAPLGSWEIIFLGNVLHHDSLIVELMESRFWDSDVYPLCTPEFKSLNPNFMNDAACRALYEEHKENDSIDIFYREYLCDPTVRGEHAPFQMKFFKPYEPSQIKQSSRLLTVVVIDPSRTAKPSSAPTGIVCWSINPSTNEVFVREVRRGYWAPEEQYSHLEELINTYNAQYLGVEITGLHEFIIHPLKTFLHNRGIFIEVLELHARAGTQEKGKIERVKELISWYRQGFIYHNPTTCGLLEDQLLAFPFARDWSLMDPFGYINEILERLEIYLNPGYDEYTYDPKVLQMEEDELNAELELEFDEFDLDDFRYLAA